MQGPVRAGHACRFSVIGELLASPPGHGELADRLADRLAELAARPFRYPTTGGTVHYAIPTLERWLYTARNHPRDPVDALARKLHARAGTHQCISPPLAEAIEASHREHPSWSYQLHRDNLPRIVSGTAQARPPSRAAQR